MDTQRGSKTAEAVAAARAWGSFSPAPKLFDDPYAADFTSPLWRILMRNGWFRRLVGRFYNWWIPGVIGEVLVRSRYAEDYLQTCVDRGLDQYVILGAGLDSFAWRRPDLEGRLRVFELDHPLSQNAKKRKLSERGLPFPKNLTFIPIDFETTSVDEALARSGCRREKTALYNWMGVTMFLTEEAVFKTLKAVAAFASPGSEIVFNYLHKEVFSQKSRFRKFKRHQRTVAGRGERFLCGFEPNALEGVLAEMGFQLVENLSPADQKNRYSSEMERSGLRPCEYIYLARAKVISR